MKSLYLGAAIAALSLAPAAAQAQFLPSQFDGNTLAGGLIGAGVGGVIGSNLAGGGVQDEGTAIGAALGGLAGAHIANSRRSDGYGGHGHSGYNHGGGYNAGYSNAGYSGGYGMSSASSYAVSSGQFVSQTYALPTQFIQQAPIYQPAPVYQPRVMSQPHTVYTSPVMSGLTYADSSVRLSGAPLVSRDTYVGTRYIEPAPIVRATREVIQGDCPAGTTYQTDGTCLQPRVTGYSSYTSSSYSSGGSVTDSDWHTLSATTYLAPSVSSHSWASSSPVVTRDSNSYESRSTCGELHRTQHKSSNAAYCYGDSAKRYDSRGHEIKSVSCH